MSRGLGARQRLLLVTVVLTWDEYGRRYGQQWGGIPLPWLVTVDDDGEEPAALDEGAGTSGVIVHEIARSGSAASRWKVESANRRALVRLAATDHIELREMPDGGYDGYRTGDDDVRLVRWRQVVRPTAKGTELVHGWRDADGELYGAR